MSMAMSTIMELNNTGQAAAALGDKQELGEGATVEHQALGRMAANLGLDLLVIYGNHRLDVADGAVEAGLAPEHIFPVAPTVKNTAGTLAPGCSVKPRSAGPH
jgi:UDP-N-acetylmuramoyl-tripeptide--D-alanyl-D-alanine ligase